jgi:glyoxylase-like metal-dependent hydrolase (beta-lactamase superfamily II)
VLERDGGVAFVPDLLVNVPGQGLRITSDEYVHDPAQARESIRKLLDLHFSALCLDHGEPVTDDPQGAIRAVLGKAS